MKKILAIMLYSFLLLLVGCGSTMKVSKQYQPDSNAVFNYKFETGATVVPMPAMEILKNRLNTESGKRNILATGDQSASQVSIIFNEYKMRADGARIMAGIFAGTDAIRTLVIVNDTDNTETLGEFSVVSKNSTAWGTTKSLIEGHADKIIKYLSGE